MDSQLNISCVLYLVPVVSLGWWCKLGAKEGVNWGQNIVLSILEFGINLLSKCQWW